MSTTAKFAALLAMLPFTALAEQSSWGTCEDAPPEFSIFEDLGDVLPPARTDLLNEPHHRITVCGNAPVFAIDESMQRGDITVRIPLGSLDVRPMTTDSFKNAIREVDVPEMWELDGETSWTLDGDTLVISIKNAPSSAASAWTQVPGHVYMRTAAGQNVVVEVSSPTMILDETRPHLANLKDRQTYIEEMLVFQKQRAADAKKRIDDPATIVTGNEEFLRQREAELAADTAAVNAMRPRLQAELAAADAGTLSVAYTRATSALPEAERAAFESLRSKLIPASNDLVRANERVKSDRAVLESFETVAVENPGPNWATHIAEWKATVAASEAAAARAAEALAKAKADVHAAALAKGVEDAALDTLDELNPQGATRFGPALRRIAYGTKSIAETKASIARERAARVESEKKGLAQALAEIQDLETELPTVKTRIANGETQRRTMKTRLPVTCPAS